MLRLFFATAFVALIAFPAQAEDTPGDFDFYVLALSWSPAYCALEGDESEEQCRNGNRYGFIAHGLWPQYERGYPEFCEDVERLPADIADSVFDIMPDRGLAAYEWRKHGSCTELSAEEYFDATRDAFDRVRIPEEYDDLGSDTSLPALAIEDAFVEANEGLDRAGIAVSCKEGLMAEVRICLTRDLEFRSCEEVDSRGCRREVFIIPRD